MKRFKTIFVYFSALALAATGLRAAENLILTVMVDEAMAAYYKVQEFAAEMEKSEAEAREQASAIEVQRDALVAEFEELREQANSDILMEQARQEAAQDAQQKAQEVQAKQNELRQFVGNTRNQFAQRRQQQLNLFYQDVAEVINEIAEERDATLVIDITARAQDGRAPILYSDGSNDITSIVIERINATQGQEATEEAAPAAE